MMRDQLIRTAWRTVAAVKNALVSDRFRDLKVWAGPARGAILHTNLRIGTRELLGLYEVELTPYVRRYVHPGQVCYDVGAAGGYYAFAFARLAAPGIVHCFEGEPEAAEQLKVLASRNAHLGSSIVVHHAVVGRIHDEPPHTSLDTVVCRNGCPAPDVIKIDAEGAELEILQGAAKLLGERRPKLLIETHSAELERACAEWLGNLGYRTTIVDNHRLMAEDLFRKGHNRWLCAE